MLENFLSGTEPDGIMVDLFLGTEPDVVLEDFLSETEPDAVLEDFLSETEPDDALEDFLSWTVDVLILLSCSDEESPGGADDLLEVTTSSTSLVRFSLPLTKPQGVSPGTPVVTGSLRCPPSTPDGVP